MLWFDLDCTDFFGHHDTRTDGGGQIDRYIDRILDGGVTTTRGQERRKSTLAWAMLPPSNAQRGQIRV